MTATLELLLTTKSGALPFLREILVDSGTPQSSLTENRMLNRKQQPNSKTMLKKAKIKVSNSNVENNSEAPTTVG